MASTHLPVLSGGDAGFYNYLHEINRIPSLTEEEEFSLAKKFLDFADLNAAHRLVTSHLKLVAKVAMGYRGYGLPVVELVSEGNIGLMQAVKKFDPEKGFRLSTYAVWWIKASIQEYVLRSWSLVKIGTTAAQKKLFFNLGKIKRRIQAVENRDFNVDDFKTIAKELDVPLQDVVEMNSRMSQDISLDDSLGDEDSDSLLDILPSNVENHELQLANFQEKELKRELFHKAMDQLNEREKYIIAERKLKENPTTLDELSVHFGVSKERVRQIEERALEKLTKMVKGDE